ncbi:MAG: secretion system protein E [Candidatus Aenigmatarchaeota archaeon]|nr:MAG: secretion system protein E [Candidatus Aenigmarchaeota archaeon]
MTKSILDQIKSMRGLLYRKLTKRDNSIRVYRKPVLRSTTRAGQLLELKKLGEYDHKKYKLKKVEHIHFKYPRFRFRTPKRFVMFSKEIPKTMRYPLIEPYAYARIMWDPVREEYIYYVIEPELSEKQKRILKKIREGLIQVIDVNLSEVRSQEKLMNYLEKNVQMLIDEYGFHLTTTEYFRIMYYIYRDFVGLNMIEPLLHDPYIEDLGCDGVGIPIYVVHRQYGSIKTNIVYNNEEELREFVIKLAERCNRYISYAEPLLDGSLPDGTRVQASLAGDVTTRGPTFSIRKFRETPFTPVDIINLGTASSEMMAYLWFAVENGVNILICGGVSTGKTSFLNAISLFMPEEAKIISIEDTRELALPHENWIPGVSRLGFGGDETGEVTMFDLLKESFRQNPDYLIVGEIRGKEAYVMFQGMASGHPSLATMHAGSVDAVIKRLETEPINLSPGLIETLDLVIILVHAREKGKSARRIKEIDEIRMVDQDTGKVKYTRAFAWVAAEDSYEYNGNSWLLHKISTEKGISMSRIQQELSRRKQVLEWLRNKSFSDWRDVVRYIRLYRKKPEQVLKMMKK